MAPTSNANCHEAPRPSTLLSNLDTNSGVPMTPSSDSINLLECLRTQETLYLGLLVYDLRSRCNSETAEWKRYVGQGMGVQCMERTWSLQAPPFQHLRVFTGLEVHQILFQSFYGAQSPDPLPPWRLGCDWKFPPSHHLVFMVTGPILRPSMGPPCATSLA